MRVGAWDRDWSVPDAWKRGKVVGVDDECGRGLGLVRACSEDWGVSAMVDLGVYHGGKVLWADCGAAE